MMSPPSKLETGCTAPSLVAAPSRCHVAESHELLIPRSAFVALGSLAETTHSDSRHPSSALLSVFHLSHQYLRQKDHPRYHCSRNDPLQLPHRRLREMTRSRFATDCLSSFDAGENTSGSLC